MRVNGRTLRPSTMAERRLLISLGTDALRVPRNMNPFTVARRFRRAAKGITPDHDFARGLVGAARVARMRSPTRSEVPVPSPDLDGPEPVLPDHAGEDGAPA
jgi:hypothetical protein